MKQFLILILFASASLSSFAQAPPPEKIKFAATDKLECTGDLYKNANREAQILILCHQAGWSRGEYIETAKLLVEMGYTCLAIDQRSGGEVNGVKNETAKKAKEQKLGTDYLDAEADIAGAVQYMNGRFGLPVILLGSSYSASLIFKVARERDEVMAVIAFSPGEYFDEKLSVRKMVLSIEDKPIFLTSSQEESQDLKMLFSGSTNSKIYYFSPSGPGGHGASVLWQEKEGHEEYWEALTTFLRSLK